MTYPVFYLLVKYCSLIDGNILPVVIIGFYQVLIPIVQVELVLFVAAFFLVILLPPHLMRPSRYYWALLATIVF